MNSKTIWTRETLFVYLVLFFNKKKKRKIVWFKLDNANSDAELETVRTAVAPQTQTSFPSRLRWMATWILSPWASAPTPPLVFTADVKKRTWLALMHWRAVLSSCWGGAGGGVWPRWRRRGRVSLSRWGECGWASRTLAPLCTSLQACSTQFRREEWRWWRGRWGG